MLLLDDSALLLFHKLLFTAQAKAYRMEKSGRGTSMVIESMMRRVAAALHSHIVAGIVRG